MKLNISKTKRLILFDGVCNLCNASVLFTIKHDKNNKFIFAALQSETGKQVIRDFNINTAKTDSIIVYNPEKNRVHTKSTAALIVTPYLGFPISLLVVFIVVPKFIRDWVYDFIAARRYKWYGKKESCMIPSPELEEKFL